MTKVAVTWLYVDISFQNCTYMITVQHWKHLQRNFESASQRHLLAAQSYFFHSFTSLFYQVPPNHLNFANTYSQDLVDGQSRSLWGFVQRCHCGATLFAIKHVFVFEGQGTLENLRNLAHTSDVPNCVVWCDFCVFMCQDGSTAPPTHFQRVLGYNSQTICHTFKNLISTDSLNSAESPGQGHSHFCLSCFSQHRKNWTTYFFELLLRVLSVQRETWQVQSSAGPDLKLSKEFWLVIICSNY